MRSGPLPALRHWVAPAAAVVGVALVVAGVVLAVNRGGPGAAVGAKGRTAGSTSGPDLKVGNGDEVVAKGIVVAAPGRPVVFCPPLPQADAGSVPGEESPPVCSGKPRPVVVTGVDLSLLSKAATRKGVRFGYAELRGVWRDWTIAVTSQGPYTEPLERSDLASPCPPPPGGWKSNAELADTGTDRLSAFIARHPDRFGAQWIAYADLDEEPPNDGPDFEHAKQIFVVGVVEGDLDDARRELASIYGGNLCVTRTEQSITRREQVAGALEGLWTDRADVLIGTSGMSSPRMLPSVDLVVMDQPMHDVLARIGWDEFDVQAAIRLVR